LSSGKGTTMREKKHKMNNNARKKNTRRTTMREKKQKRNNNARKMIM
jgi:hypothetical protein